MIARTIAVSVCCASAVAIGPTTLATSRTVVVATPAQTCPASANPISPDQVAGAWSVVVPLLDKVTRAGPAGGFPFGRTGSGSYQYTGAYAWTSGFGATALWLAYQHTSDPSILRQARAFTNAVLPVARWTGTHDLGFMVGNPARLGSQLDPSPARRAAYRTAMRTAARSLSTRWNARIGAIRSGEYGGKWGLIVDSAMNAPLLIEVGQSLAGPEGRRLASRGHRHMLTLAEHFVRTDGSTFHRKAFDPHTGVDLGPVAGQGLATTSTWARGQAWAIAGFARAYELTNDEALLDAARGTADFWIGNVRAGCVPAWDLAVSDERAPRDSSAAAIATAGLLSLAAVEPDPARAAAYRSYALTTLATLVSAPFVDPTAAPGLLQRQAYNVPADRREGSYSWGDAYLLTSLSLASTSG